ncbi:universal stress protein [Halegenticoccus tardaugens]|uniref:universal stress protein n=1 Tax=Halegenticoccus tardaugens TaxID=2071624 RepID=UPI0013E93BF5|nr:universal stress protein [Halegenticoccus tardaugens]
MTVDGSERAKKILREADRLANAFNDELHVVHVIAYDDTDLDIGVTSTATGERLIDIAVQQVQDIVGDTISEYKAVGLVGKDVKVELNDYLEGKDVRYAVIGGRRVHQLERHFSEVPRSRFC